MISPSWAHGIQSLCLPQTTCPLRINARREEDVLSVERKGVSTVTRVQRSSSIDTFMGMEEERGEVTDVEGGWKWLESSFVCVYFSTVRQGSSACLQISPCLGPSLRWRRMSGIVTLSVSDSLRQADTYAQSSRQGTDKQARNHSWIWWTGPAEMPGSG